MVLDSKTAGLGNPMDFVEVYPELLEALWDRRMVVYDAPYDRRGWKAAVDLTTTTEYGKSVPQISGSVRRNIIDRMENLVARALPRST